VTFRIPDDLHEKVIRSIEHCTTLAAIVLGKRGLLLAGIKAGRNCRTLQSQLLNLSFLALPRSMQKLAEIGEHRVSCSIFHSTPTPPRSKIDSAFRYASGEAIGFN
jgi:hypothetical protein